MVSDVQEVTEEGLYDDIEGEQGKKIKVEVQGQGEKDVIDGSLRIEELGMMMRIFMLMHKW